MAAANVNVPDILDEAVAAMEDAEDEEEDEEIEEEEDEDEDVEDAEDEAEEDRDLLMYSFAVFGYNARTCEAIVEGLNIRVPADLIRFSDTRVDTLAAALLRRHVYRANAAVKLPLTIGDDLHVYKTWATELLWQGVPHTADLFDEEAVARTQARLDELRINKLAARPEAAEPVPFKDPAMFIEFKRAFDHACAGLL